MSNNNGMHYKVINDSVHGLMAFHPLIVSLMDTPEMQRLRNIKQLGPTCYVYPTASHNRFEHSLGTCHLAGQMLSAIEQTDLRQDLRPTKQEKLCVLIAGLCHDIGHGPFSHTWEKFLSKCGISWNHEDGSLEFIDQLLRSDEIKPECAKYGLTEEHITLIKNLIKVPEKLEPEYCKKHYLFQIISNKDYEVDVDKWDYLLRDQKQLNLKSSFDPQRFLNLRQVLNVRREGMPYDRFEMCFRDKEITNLYDMLIARASLHQKAYQHPIVKTIEVMLIDAFVAAQKGCPELKLTDTSPANLIKLTDALFYQILHSDHSGLQDAKKILQRIERRKLYQRHAGAMPEDFFNRDKKEETEFFERAGDRLYDLIKADGDDVKRDEIEFALITIDMGQKRGDEEKYYMPKCYVYRKNSQVPEKCYDANPHMFGKLLKPILQKSYLCLYKGPIDMTTNGRLKSLVQKLD